MATIPTMNQLSFAEWLRSNPVEYADDDPPCHYCRGTKTQYLAILDVWDTCEMCNGTGKQVVSFAHDEYVHQAIKQETEWNEYWKQQEATI